MKKSSSKKSNIKHIALLALLFFCCQVGAQKYELGKVSVKELQEKACPIDTTTAAAIIYNKAKSAFIYRDKTGFSLEHVYEFRIKIYKKEGLSWANFSVPYYIGYKNINKDMIQFTEAVTYNLENGSIVKTKLGNEGKFKKDLNEFWGEASITMPNVKIGSVIEFKYTLRSEDVVEFPTFHFQYEIPVIHSEYRTEIPEFFIYKPILTGTRQIKSDAKIETGYQNFSDKYQHSVNMSYNQVVCNYSTENIPALKDEDYVDNIRNYRSSLTHELEKIRFPDQDVKNYTTTWEGVAALIYKEDNFGKELTKFDYFRPSMVAFAASDMPKADKVNAIFDYVKRNMHWDGKYGYLTRKGVQHAFADKTGNVAEINLMLVAMLNFANISAYPVLLSTKDNGIPVFPNRTIFNYVIAAVEIDGKQVLYDATEEYASANVLPSRDINWIGRLIRQDGTSMEINLIPELQSRQAVNMMVKADASGVLSGKTRIQKTDYYSFAFREKYQGMNQQQYLEKLEADFDGIQVTEYKADIPKKAAEAVTETFDFTSTNHSEIIGDKMYISPMLFFTAEKNPFKAETREYPVYYGYPFQQRYLINFEVPEGYEIASTPTPVSVAMSDELGSFKYNITVSGKQIQAAITMTINHAIISAAHYETLKGFYKTLIEKQNEKIVLKKI